MKRAAWDPALSHIRVTLRNVQTEAQVGLHAWERHPQRPTRLLVSVDMLAPVTGPADRQPFIDYDIIRAALKTWPARPHTDLLETLAEELVSLCFQFPSVAACQVSILKPDIFNDAEAVGVELFRVKES